MSTSVNDQMTNGNVVIHPQRLGDQEDTIEDKKVGNLMFMSPSSQFDWNNEFTYNDEWNSSVPNSPFPFTPSTPASGQTRQSPEGSSSDLGFV